MLLKKWRATKGLTIAQATQKTGFKSSGAFSDLERGIDYAGPETIARIEAATRGAVTSADILRAWELAHPQQSKTARAAGRAAAKSVRIPAKKESNHGGKSHR